MDDQSRSGECPALKIQTEWHKEYSRIAIHDKEIGETLDDDHYGSAKNDAYAASPMLL